MNHLRLALLGLAAIAALILGAGFLERAFRADKGAAPDVPSVISAPIDDPASPAVQTPIRRKLDETIATVPDYTRFFDRFRSVFPGEYNAFLTALATDVARTAVAPDADSIMTDAVIALRKSRGALASKASDEALAKIFVLQLAEMRALGKRDVHLCVAFLYGANGTGFLGFAADNRPLVADAALAGLDAMSSGRTDQIQRGPPSDADFQILDRALNAKGLSRPEIEALLDGKTADPPIADERMCAAGQTYLETLAGIDPGARAKLYGLAVDLMAKT